MALAVARQKVLVHEAEVAGILENVLLEADSTDGQELIFPEHLEDEQAIDRRLEHHQV